MSQYLDLNSFLSFWTKIDKRDTEIVRRIKALEQSPGFSGEIPVLYGTTAEWNSQISMLSKRGTIYIYGDYQKENEENIAGIKIGDGQTYLIDLPFIDTVYLKHINNLVIHITDEERQKWNNKVSAEYKEETLYLKNSI